jgi:Cu(I)/Ag(I) efflux system membrane fusion protein
MTESTKSSWLMRVGVPVALILALGLGIWIGGAGGGPEGPAGEKARPEKPTPWTCSMHPQIRMPEKGKCPICHMDLIPVEDGSAQAEDGPRDLSMSEQAKRLARVATAPVERLPVQHQLRLFGQVDYDETRVTTIASWVNGRIDRLYVDYTGVAVKRGDHLVKLYSPELLTTQRELIAAARSAGRYQAGDKGPAARASRGLLQAARERLRLWGLNRVQIDRIVERKKASEQITIYAPQAGVVIEKNGQEGMYVKTGTRLYTIADLSRVWVQLEAYESDLNWLRYGQEALISVDSLPGETFTGRVSFLDPYVDPKKRTARVRVILDNRDGRLRPGAFVRGTIAAGIAETGKLLAPDLSGKWISPMHPEVIRDKPGRCPVCGMALVRAESLGLAGAASSGQAPLSVPASAPLITGKRALVYVELPDRAQPTYQMREIKLGPRAGDRYVVLEGLAEGEAVVIEGNFKLDSAMQILAKPSMMSPEGGAPPPGHHHGHADPEHAEPGKTPESAKPSKPEAPDRLAAPADFLTALAAFAEAYLKVQTALAKDDPAATVAAAAGLPASLSDLDMSQLAGHAHHRFMALQKNIQQAIESLRKASDLTAQRQAFQPLSNGLRAALREFGYPADRTYYQVHCPMAFDNRGAWWIQADDAVANPYFGESMLRCADVTEKIPPVGPEPPK